MTMEGLLQLLNHCGTFAFAMSGIRLVEYPKHWRKSFMGAFLCAFGGGLTRDLILLHHRPALFDSKIDILITILTILFFVLLHHFRMIHFLDSRPAKISLFLFDSAGTAMFICVGVETAISCGGGMGVTLLSGVLTAMGGGIWAALVAGQPPRSILQNAISYRLIVLCHAAVYTFGRSFPIRDVKFFDISLAATCIICCYVRWRILERVDINQEEVFQKRRWNTSLRKLFSQSRSQLFWRVVNPLRGIKNCWVFGNPQGKHLVICSTFFINVTVLV